jgi:hypothetical protein
MKKHDDDKGGKKGSKEPKGAKEPKAAKEPKPDKAKGDKGGKDKADKGKSKKTAAPAEAPVIDLTGDPGVPGPVAPPSPTPSPDEDIVVTPDVGSFDMPRSVWNAFLALAKELVKEDAAAKRFRLDERLAAQVLGVIYTDDGKRAKALLALTKAADDWAAAHPLENLNAEPLP